MQTFSFHNHTPRCGHAEDFTDRELVEAHIRKGFKQMAFTDHCPWQGFTNEKNPRGTRMPYNQKEEYLASIRKLKEEYKDKITILSGFEFEYIPYLEHEIEAMKKETDIIIQGQHVLFDQETGEPLKMHKKDFVPDHKQTIQYAKLIETSMKNGFPDYIAHPDLFMLNKFEFGSEDEEASHIIASAAEKYDIPLELNMEEFAKAMCMEKDSIMYPRQEFWKIAVTYKIKVVWGLDTHMLFQVEKEDLTRNLTEQHLGKDLLSKINFYDITQRF